MWENLYNKSYQNCQTALKTFKKHQNVPTGTHKKRQILFHRFLGDYTLLLDPLLFLRGNENPKNWVGVGPIFKKSSKLKGRAERKIQNLMRFFHFNLLTISCHGN